VKASGKVTSQIHFAHLTFVMRAIHFKVAFVAQSAPGQLISFLPRDVSALRGEVTA